MILHHWVKVQNINILILENEDMTFYSNVGVQLPLMQSHIPEVCSCELQKYAVVSYAAVIVTKPIYR
jgi:hypothetical protein